MDDFLGYKVVQLNDCSREVVRFYKESGLTAILQKNGNVAVSGTGLFSHQINPFIMGSVAKCFYGLKLITKDKLEPYLKAAENYRRELDIISLKYDAKQLGFKVEEKK